RAASSGRSTSTPTGPPLSARTTGRYSSASRCRSARIAGLASPPTNISAMSPVGYLDAGSGSMLLQIVLGGVAAIGVTAKMTWRRVLRTLRIRRDDDDQS